MESIFAVLLIVFVSAITPGPNNFIVMNVAVRNGFIAVFYPIMGIVLGAIVLAILAWVGISRVVASSPALRDGIAILGNGYLIWLGYSIMFMSYQDEFAKKEEIARDSLPNSLIAIFLFQFMNPKAWVLITTITTELANKYSPNISLIYLLVILLVVPTFCLVLWAKLGSCLAAVLQKPKNYSMFNLIMGSLLIFPAVTLLVKGIIT